MRMTAKRWEIIDEEFISYTGGTAQLISNGECEIHLWETPKDAQLFCDKLNAINEENEQLKEEVKSLREHFIYLIATALEDKECRKIYAEALLEIFDDCNDLNEAKSKIKEYLE